MRIQQANRNAKSFGQFESFGEITVIGYHERFVDVAACGVIDEVNTQIHIRPFLLLNNDFRQRAGSIAASHFVTPHQ